MGRQINNSELNLIKLAWLALGIALAGFPHWERLPFWIPAIHLTLLIARIFLPFQFSSFWSQQKTLISLARLFIMTGGVIGVYSSYGSLAGRDVGVALLVLLAGLKIFESNSKRDFYICTYLGYFLVITNFFYGQTIPTALYMFFVIIIMTGSLIGFNDTEEQLAFFERFKLSTTLLLQSIPILLVLFILFPRVNGPLWGLPKDAFTGTTGIDDQMTPGTISKLVQSSEVAFRVTFQDKIPEQSKLYWRGPVLWQTDGRKWTPGIPGTDRTAPPVKFLGDNISYDVIFEPTNKKWLFALELANQIPEQTHLGNDYQLMSNDPLRARKALSLTSNINFKLGKNSNNDLERGLALPENSHPRTREFGTNLRQQYKDPEKIVQAALSWLKNGNFTYTLKPPLITGDMVDEFLFSSKQGFCEYYAAAFTVLMRSAGVPARIVTGYLGGEVNPIGNYLIVRQYNAHAWTEVWLEGQGWTRVDPTSVVSPGRVNEGIENALPDTIINIPFGLENNSTALRFWQKLRNTVDMVNYQWAQWVLGYGPERQQRLLQKIGLNSINWKKLTLILIFLLGIIVALLAFYIFKKTPISNDPAKKYYDAFCKKMAQSGLPRRTYEGPVDYACRTSTIRRDLKNDINMITNLYISIRYCSNHDKLINLKTAIKTFSPDKIISVTE